MITAGFFRDRNFAHVLMSAVVLRAETAGCFIGRYFQQSSHMWNYVERWTRSFSPCWTAVTWGEPQHQHCDADNEQHRHFSTERRKCLCEAAAVCRWIHVLREYLCQWDRSPFICPSAVTARLGSFSQLHTALCYLYSRWWWRWVTLPLRHYADNQLITGWCVFQSQNNRDSDLLWMEPSPWQRPLRHIGTVVKCTVVKYSVVLLYYSTFSPPSAQNKDCRWKTDKWFDFSVLAFWPLLLSNIISFTLGAQTSWSVR